MSFTTHPTAKTQDNLSDRQLIDRYYISGAGFLVATDRSNDRTPRTRGAIQPSALQGPLKRRVQVGARYRRGGNCFTHQQPRFANSAGDRILQTMCGRGVAAVPLPLTHKRGKSLTSTGSKNIQKDRGVFPGLLSRCAAHPSSSLLPHKLRARCHRYLFYLTTLPIIMFSKTALASLALGVLCINALAVPVAREPAPEPECEFPGLSRPYRITF